jgi:putative phosphoserine phosphatase / 1-acylglycerol-3-phosphate O-acyltransferase
MTSIAFFDVDKTLMDGYSGFYTTLILIQKGILKKRRLPQALFYRLIRPRQQGNVEHLRQMYQIAIHDMAGSTLDRILTVGRECFERWIRPRMYQEALDKIEEHKAKGDLVYLVTSGPYMTIRIMAEFLGVHGYYSAGPVIDDRNILTRELRLPIYYRQGKLHAAEEAIARHQVAWKDCYFYSDSIDDIFLLEKVGYPHLVNPDKKLLKIGQEKGWPVLHFKRLLQNG